MYGQEKNNVYIQGEIVSGILFWRDKFEEGFYDFFVKIERLSGAADILPVTLSERLSPNKIPCRGERLCAIGQFRSYNKLDGDKSRLKLTVFVREIITENLPKKPNSVELSGYICKPPIYRITPFNREICDIMLAVNREHNKSDYIPCIAWGRNAHFASTLTVGDMLTVSGRIQSREYQKQTHTGIETKTAYEVSISAIATITDKQKTRLFGT